MKPLYYVKKAIEYGCEVYQVINRTTDVVVYYDKEKEIADAFCEKCNRYMEVTGIKIISTVKENPTLHDEEFKAWARGKDFPFFDKLSDVIENPIIELKKGQKCAVINAYKVLLHGFTIMGFSKPDEYGQCVYLNWDCYWYPVTPEEIVLE